MNSFYSFTRGMLLFIGIALLSAFSPSNTAKQSSDPIVGLQVGNLAPDLSFESPDGKTIALSELKGNIVLIDFWASWCGPCRRNNPHLVQIYDKYKSAKFKTAKGFEIYSVSLDRSKGSWTKAIEKDDLHWAYHVSDLKGWHSAAANTYNVSSIPSAFLIDENGIILATGQQARHPQLLQSVIDNHVKKFK